MRVPVSVFDLYLAAQGRPVATLLREDAANRLTQVFREFAEAGLLYARDGAPIAADAVRFTADVRELETPYASLAEARKAGLLPDDATLERALLAQRRAAPDIAPEADAPTVPSDGAESAEELA